jgi:hypothetical protein
MNRAIVQIGDFELTLDPNRMAGRIPAMFNGCIGIKPTLGWWTTQGVVPACRSLDCISVFAQSVVDGALVARVIEVNVAMVQGEGTGFDAQQRAGCLGSPGCRV